MLFPALSLLVFCFLSSEGAELSRCCSGGSRHYSQTDTCSGIKSEGSSLACHRTASICCLRQLLDNSCDMGTQMAKEEHGCPTNINILGGGLKKECCDCCLLAKDLLRRNVPCQPPSGFSSLCLRSFNKCCMTSTEITASETLLAKKSDGTTFHFGDRCLVSKCDHLCNDRGGESVECSCRHGYDLAADGISCIDIDECHSTRRILPCDPVHEECINTPGGYMCRPLYAERRRLRDERRSSAATFTSHKHRLRDPQSIIRRGNGVQNDDVSKNRAVDANEIVGRGAKEPASSRIDCPMGFHFQSGSCIDVDECLLLMDDCLESQRCLNTPGSFKCIRTLSCGTGYALDSETELCIDVDECTLGAHDCGPLYQCKNTQGSYRCQPKKCTSGELQNPITGECTSIDCPLGYEPSNGRCIDVNECASEERCGPTEECFNTPGSFRCQLKGSLCSMGYSLNQNTGFCDDIDECQQPGACDGLQCTNLPGSFKCRCLAGFEFNDKTKKCEDIDECAKFSGHVCDALAKCVNTVGSFLCKCKEGFESAADGRHCVDIDECKRGLAHCQQKCVNIPGSYQCICERGYSLSADGLHCQDIDECSVWAGSGNDLCMGECYNTPGSYRCACPSGYNTQPDGRTCQDIDECHLGECQSNDRICVNTLGSYKCHYITCPHNYIHDKNYKNRCIRTSLACGAMAEESCKKHLPLHITFQYIGIPRNVPISTHRPSITIFTIRGPSQKDSSVQFELILNNTQIEYPGVIQAERANFLLQKGVDRNSAVIALRDPLDGPQVITLHLILRLSKHGSFHANNVEDGYSCLKSCGAGDLSCVSNITREILYQYRAIPSTSQIFTPIEVSRIRAQMGAPFSVEYILDASNRRHFKIEQERSVGIVKLIEPMQGPKTEVVKVNIHTKSRTGVVVAHNVAIIQVDVSRYSF